MAPKYQLTYFNVRGRAEPVRILFAYAKVPYEDKRITFEQWQDLKPNTPFGQLPVLEIDGVMVEQSVALCRYLARQFGLDGSTDLEKLQVDAFVAHVEDLKEKLGPSFAEKDPEKKQAILKNIRNEVSPVFLEKFERRIAKNGGYTVGKTILWSDIHLATLIDGFAISDLLPDDFAQKYPHVAKIKDKIFNTPQVKAYVEKRPQTPI